jgi:hypothetical protein
MPWNGMLRHAMVGRALALYAAWTLATYLLEGWPRTLLRPEAVGLRLTYTLIANVVVGLIGGALLLRGPNRTQGPIWEAAGFGSARRSSVATPIGLVAGAALYVGQGAPSLDPVVVLNAFSQVLPVSAAEVVVCWSVVGGAIAATARGRGVLVSRLVAAVAASALFGLYHAAHSPPFNETGMIVLLTVVGLATSVFFFTTRDMLGTLAFHNFLALFGVVRALADAGKLEEYQQLQAPLLVMALVAIALVVAMRFSVQTRQS